MEVVLDHFVAFLCAAAIYCVVLLAANRKSKKDD